MARNMQETPGQTGSNIREEIEDEREEDAAPDCYFAAFMSLIADFSTFSPFIIP